MTTTLDDLMRAVERTQERLEKMDEKNDTAHFAIHDRLEARHVESVALSERVCGQEKRCNRRGQVLISLAIGTALAVIGSLITLIVG